VDDGRRRGGGLCLCCAGPRVRAVGGHPDGLARVAPLGRIVGCVLFALNEAGKLGAARWLLVPLCSSWRGPVRVFYQVREAPTHRW